MVLHLDMAEVYYVNQNRSVLLTTTETHLNVRRVCTVYYTVCRTLVARAAL